MIKRRWTLNDEERLIKLLQMNVKPDEIAMTLARTPHAITCKINELKEQGITPKKIELEKKVIVDGLGKIKQVVSSEPVVIVKEKKKRSQLIKPKVEIQRLGKIKQVVSSEPVVIVKEKKKRSQLISPKVEIQVSPAPIPSKLTFNLFGEKFKIESCKVQEFFASINSLGQILNKEIEIKFK